MSTVSFFKKEDHETFGLLNAFDLKFRVNKQFFRFFLIAFLASLCAFHLFLLFFFCNSLSFSDSATMRGVNPNQNRKEACIFLQFLLIFHQNFQGGGAGEEGLLEKFEIGVLILSGQTNKFPKTNFQKNSLSRY